MAAPAVPRANVLKRLSIAGAIPPLGPYSPAVRAGDFLIISGQIPVDPFTGVWEDGDLQLELPRLFSNLDLLLHEAAAHRSHLVKCTVFLADPASFPAVAPALAQYFDGALPALTRAGVRFRNPRMQVEIEAIAYTPSGKDPMIERITPPGCPEPHGPYSPAVRAGDFIYVSGQASVDPVTQAWSFGDVQHETRRTLENIKLILSGCGAQMADVVKCTVFLKDGRDFAAMNQVYTEFFALAKPARSTVEVRFANPDMKIEVEAIAYLPRQ